MFKHLVMDVIRACSCIFHTAIASLSSVILNRLLYSLVFEEVKLGLIFSSCFLMF